MFGSPPQPGEEAVTGDSLSPCDQGCGPSVHPLLSSLIDHLTYYDRDPPPSEKYEAYSSIPICFTIQWPSSYVCYGYKLKIMLLELASPPTPLMLI
jgi:hypothetical protein